MLALIRREPVAFGAVVHAVIVCVAAFAGGLTADQTAALALVETALIGFVVRAHVSPTSTSS